MQTLNVGAMVIKMYDSIEDLPILRYHKFNKCLLVDAGIGADIGSVDRHLLKARTYIRSGKAELAEIELENMRQNINFIANNITPRLLAFAALVAEIDGEPQTDITDSGLQRIAEKLQQATLHEINSAVDAQKKKIDDELKAYFADVFDNESDKEYYDLLRSRTLAVLRSITENPDPDTVEKLTQRIMLHVKPKPFVGKDNAEIRYEKNFDKLCIHLSEYTNGTVKSLTVLEFYNLYEYAKEVQKQRQKTLKKK